MARRALWTGFLSFGLVNVPVGLYPATSDGGVRFHQLHKGTPNRMRHKKVDEETGKEVANSNIVRGLEVDHGGYVVVTPEELKRAAPGRSERIEICDFVDLASIDPLYYRQAYYLAPRGAGADHAYALLRRTMQDTGRAGIATFVLRDKEHLVAVRPDEEVLVLHTMYFADEILDPENVLGDVREERSFDGRELAVARQLVESLTTEWSPRRYHDTFRERVAALVAEKRDGQEVVLAEEPPRATVVDLMSVLEASLARGGRAAAPRGGGSRARSSKHATRDPAQPGASTLSRAELLARAAELEIPGRSKMSKHDLAEAIAAATPPRGRRVS